MIRLPITDELSTAFWLILIVFVTSTLWLLQRLLTANARARAEARAARDALAAAQAGHRALISRLAHRDDLPFLPIPVTTCTDAIHPLTVLLLALWAQAVVERDAFRDWVTEDPHPTDLTPQLLQALAAQTDETAAPKDNP